MKRLLALALVLAVVCVTAPRLFAYEDLPTRMFDVELRKNTFDELAADTAFTGSTTYATPQTTKGTLATGTAYQGTVEPPFLMRIQNTAAAGTSHKIFITEYSSSAYGPATTTAQSCFLESKKGNVASYPSGQLEVGETWEKIFYQDPNLTIGGNEASTFRIQLFTRPSQ